MDKPRKKEKTQFMICEESTLLNLGLENGFKIVCRSKFKPPEAFFSIQMFPISDSNLPRAPASSEQSNNKCSTVSLPFPQEQFGDSAKPILDILSATAALFKSYLTYDIPESLSLGNCNFLPTFFRNNLVQVPLSDIFHFSCHLFMPLSLTQPKRTCSDICSVLSLSPWIEHPLLAALSASSLPTISA